MIAVSTSVQEDYLIVRTALVVSARVRDVRAEHDLVKERLLALSFPGVLLEQLVDTIKHRAKETRARAPRSAVEHEHAPRPLRRHGAQRSGGRDEPAHAALKALERVRAVEEPRRALVHRVRHGLAAAGPLGRFQASYERLRQSLVENLCGLDF